MDKEKRHLVKDEGDKLIKMYEDLAEEAKAKGSLAEAYGYAVASRAILEYQLHIMLLDAQDKI